MNPLVAVGLLGGALLAALLLYLANQARGTSVSTLRRERGDAQQMAELHMATIEALAAAIDAKDQTGHNHIRRVQLLASGLARFVGLSDLEVQAIRTAALLLLLLH